MESALRHFREGYCDEDCVKAVLALNMIAHSKVCGFDDMKESTNLAQSHLIDSAIAINDSQGLEKWVMICALLSNCNFLEHKAMERPHCFRKCILLAVERANITLNFFLDAIQNTEAERGFFCDIQLLIVLLRRMRRSVRHLSSLGSFDFDPISLYTKILTKCYFHFKKSLLKIKKRSSLVANTIKSIIGDVLIEIWRVNPFTAGLDIKTRDINSIVAHSNMEKSSALYFYYGIYLFNSGNLQGAERAFAKATALNTSSIHEKALFFFSVSQLSRGFVPRAHIRASNSSTLSLLKGVVAGILSGRVDVFDAACEADMNCFLRLNVALQVVNSRLIVLRNMIALHQLLLKEHKERVCIQDLWESCKDLVKLSSGSTYFESSGLLRDAVLLPLVIQKYINGCVYIDHDILNLSGSNAFPPLDLSDGIVRQPIEPIEKSFD